VSIAKRLLREPLFHFLVAGVLIFVLSDLLGRSQRDVGLRVVITQDQIERLAALWERVRQRPPTATELKGLVDDYVKEEIFYREALALGLDRNDTIIRRRLRQKMEFLTSDIENDPEPSEAELNAYLKRHANRYQIEPKVAIRQIYLNTDRRGTAASRDAERFLSVVKAKGGDADISAMGDPTQLPAEISLSSKSEIARIFGEEFASKVVGLDIGKWVGPLRSAYGAHIVIVQQRKDGRKPVLHEVRKVLKRDWLAERRIEKQQDRFELLRQAYTITIEWPQTVQNAAGERP